MAIYPPRGLKDWDDDLRAYLDAVTQDAEGRPVSEMALLDQEQATAEFASRQVADLIAGRFPMPSERKLIGPVAAGSDAPVVVYSATPSGAYTKAYMISGTTLPADWPVYLGPGPSDFASNFSWPIPRSNFRNLRVMCDGSMFAFQTLVNAPLEGGVLLFVNGAPVSLTPGTLGNGTTYTTMVFPDARPRLIEIMTNAGFRSVHTANPYRCWMPPIPAGQKILVIGDSYSAGVTFGASASVEMQRIYGFAATLGLYLGAESTYWTDGVGGTGYLKTGAGVGNYATRLPAHYASEPDVVIVGGGGSNDLFGASFSQSQIIAAATNLFIDARSALPNAKLVFMEGFSPPNGFSTFKPDYIAIRAALQAALVDIGVYYVDIATTAAWIDGSGYIGATTGTGNSDLYIGADGIHPSPAGGPYIRERLAPKLRAILSDNGDLLNQLV